ncbi:3-methyladenine DNA glycosylase [Saxibacter everestensis]|uniref:3-methyladenine DNA glycosylase n=1 Tax=Saxibacter everestensis TaxID=2909229 RepID=A0ABY8QVH2_9MICO|nr:3-methyladenine DNA glycosylase [Brevibacteriaceae bacterium ZFBP1038]
MHGNGSHLASTSGDAGLSRPRLSPAEWRAREAAHLERATALTEAHLARRSRAETHPVQDFLFTYYPFKPGQLKRWHPGAEVELVGAAERADWRWYSVDPAGTASVDADRYLADRGDGLLFIRELLLNTSERRAEFGCFGLHEWAMVYRQSDDDVRHNGVPLRLGSDGTDAVVERHRIRCSHFDAFRFFTDEAAPMNEFQPTRERMRELEQPGCLHAGMDLYKWAAKLGPLVPGELLLDCFDLAQDIRELDMRASPYDLSGWGYVPVAIETPDGKAAYVSAQREFGDRGNRLRARLLAALEAINVAPR